MLIDKGAASRAELEDADRELAMAEGESAVAKAALSAVQAQGGNTTIRAVRRDGHGAPAQSRRQRARRRQRSHSAAHRSKAGAGDGDTAGRRYNAICRRSDRTRHCGGQSKQDLLRVATRPAPETGAKTVEVTLAFDTPTELQPGTQVGIEIDAEQRWNVPLVPAIAVIRDNPDQPVVVVAAGSVAQRARRNRPCGRRKISDTIGLKPGELIITQGHSTLRDGTPK